MTPEMEMKMELEVEGIDPDRDWDVQQHKAEVYAEFERRMQAAFPEGLRIYSFEFGLDRGWHDELKDD
nr:MULTISPECIES: hypothetical protein [unclassified Thioalkalivibrio]